jgi:hypothetical protein
MAPFGYQEFCNLSFGLGPLAFGLWPSVFGFPSTRAISDEIGKTKGQRPKSTKVEDPVTIPGRPVSMSVGSSPVNKQGFQEQEDKKRDEEIWKD